MACACTSERPNLSISLDLASATFAELQQIGNYNDALMNLEAGAVDAVCMDIGVASYNVKKSEEKTKNGYGVAIVDTDDDICPKCVSVEGVLKAQVI